MGMFRDAQDVYDCIGRIFEEAIADPEIGPKTKESGLTIRFNYNDPASVIYVDFAQGEVLFGDDVPREPQIVEATDAIVKVELFSHRRAVLTRPTWFDMPTMYAPYTAWKERLNRKLF